jgi:hypothetical protein
MTYLPIEILDYIIIFGFPWFYTSFRLVNKELKEHVDKMIRGIRVLCVNRIQKGNFVWNSLHNVTISVKDKDNILMLSIISEISNILILNTNKRINNKDCVNMYDIVYNICNYYHLNGKIYVKLEKLFDNSLAKCYHEGKFNSSYANHIMRFYRIIFVNMLYYTRFLGKKNVDDLLDERLHMLTI